MAQTGIGRRLRTLRMQHGLSGKELAHAVGVSPSLISRIEHGKANFSLDLLYRVAEALGCRVRDLLEDDAAATLVDDRQERVRATPIAHMIVRKSERLRMMRPASLTTYELLTPSLNGRHELLCVTLKPGTDHVGKSGAHLEGEETVLAMKGVCEIVVGDQQATLWEGDAITYDATMPHRMINAGEGDLILICVMTPPHVGI